MANPEHVNALGLGPKEFATWQLSRKDPSHLDFSGAEIKGISLAGLYLAHADFSDATLEDVDFTNSTLINADFGNANIANSTFKGANVALANFNTAGLNNVSFDSANCTGVDFIFCELSRVTFRKAILNRIKLHDIPSEIGNATGAQLEYHGILYKPSDGHTARLLASYISFDISKRFVEFLRDGIAASFSRFVQLFSIVATMYPRIALNAVALVTWPVVRKYGSLAILTRASYLMLVLVPPLAFMWPTISSLATTEGLAAQRAIESAARVERRLNRMLPQTQASQPSPEELLEVRRSIDSLAERTAQLEKSVQTKTQSHPRFPLSLAALFFAALFVVLGHLIYQIWADDIILESSKSSLIERATAGYSDQTDHGKLRLVDALREIQTAANAEPDKYHSQLIASGGTLFWIPERVEDFSKLIPRFQWATLESAAEIKFDRAARRTPAAALASLFAYSVATILITYVVLHQSRAVWSAAELGDRFLMLVK